MKHIKGLDGLRAISILMVILNHSGIDEKLQEIEFVKANYNLISGTTGVNIFFVISGFLITQLLLQEKNRFGNIDFKLFFARRFLRLTPPFLVLILVILGLMLSDVIPSNLGALTLSFFYLYNFVEHANYIGELGHTWSLAVEEQFYLLWPSLLALSTSFKKTIFGLTVFVFVCIGVRYLYQNAAMFYIENFYLIKNYYIDRWFIPAAYSIAIGAIAAILQFYEIKFLLSFIRLKWWPLLLFVLLYFIQLIFSGVSLQLVFFLMPISIAVLMLWMYNHQYHFIVRMLDFYPLAFIGKMSYGIYIFQGLYLRTGPGGALWIQQYPTNLILVFTTALASYFLLEQPVLRLKSKFVRSQNSPATNS